MITWSSQKSTSAWRMVAKPMKTIELRNPMLSLKVPMKWKIICAYLKGLSKEWRFSFWNIFFRFRDMGIFLLCKLDNNNNNNNYSFWSASLRLGALTILNRNIKKKNWWLFTKFLYSWSKLQYNYNDERKKRMWLLLIEKISF